MNSLSVSELESLKDNILVDLSNLENDYRYLV